MTIEKQITQAPRKWQETVSECKNIDLRRRQNQFQKNDRMREGPNQSQVKFIDDNEKRSLYAQALSGMTAAIFAKPFSNAGAEHILKVFNSLQKKQMPPSPIISLKAMKKINGCMIPRGYKGFFPYFLQQSYTSPLGFGGTKFFADKLENVPYAIRPIVAGGIIGSVESGISLLALSHEMKSVFARSNLPNFFQLFIASASRNGFAWIFGEYSLRYSKERELLPLNAFLWGSMSGAAAGVLSTPLQNIVYNVGGTDESFMQSGKKIVKLAAKQYDIGYCDALKNLEKKPSFLTKESLAQARAIHNATKIIFSGGSLRVMQLALYNAFAALYGQYQDSMPGLSCVEENLNEVFGSNKSWRSQFAKSECVNNTGNIPGKV